MGVISKPYHGSYWNPWYLINKTTLGKYIQINVVVELNWVTIRDVNLPPFVDEFSEEFASYASSFLIAFFFSYDQVEIHEESQDFTVFMTPLGLM